MTDRPQLPPTHAPPSQPKLKLPPGSADTHFHVFGPGKRFPYLANLKATPPDAPKEDMFALHKFLGIDHGVIVHTSSHGHDNRATEEAVIASNGTYRAVALVPVTVETAELKRLSAAGFCGARFHYMHHLTKGASIDEVIAFGKRLADIGWHLQLHFEPDLIAELTPAIKRSPVPVTIDHMGRIDAALGLEQPAFHHLLKLMDDKNVWMKVSGCDRATAKGPPYADAVPFARKLVAEFGDRCVWGTDWPHPNHAPPIPDDGLLVDILAEIAPGAALQAVMVDNPQRFYKFKKAGAKA
jgi:2-pyrone-4,6-dicarboxylate lactonase